MSEISIAVGLLALIIVLIGVVVQFWKCAYDNGRLEELVKQKDAEIKQLKRAMRDDD